MRLKYTNLVLTTLLILFSTGCSSLGLSLWPAQFPLLNQTREFAARSPVPSGMSHELAKQPIDTYYVEPGDRLLIEPVRFDSEFPTAGDQLVQVDGSIDLGRFGRLRATGMTVEDIEVAVEERLVQMGVEREPINVQLIEANASEVYVLGEVGSPGSYALNGNETVLDAIVMAGGLTSRASPCDIILVRPTLPNECRVVQRVCYRQITQLGDVTTNYQLQPGDRVVIGSRTLCEELAFWRQTTACECCSRSRCIECQPSAVNYQNRFNKWFSAFPLPRQAAVSDGDETTASDQDAAATPINPQAANDLPDVVPGPTFESMESSSRMGVADRALVPDRNISPAEDEDIYLPQITPREK